jgi:hypothetical protein
MISVNTALLVLILIMVIAIHLGVVRVLSLLRPTASPWKMHGTPTRNVYTSWKEIEKGLSKTPNSFNTR